MSTPKAVKSSAECSKRTIQRRNNLLRKQIEFATSSSPPLQTSYLVKSFGKSEQKELAENIGIGKVEITPEEMVALKAKLGIPWEKLKTMGR